MLYTLRGIVLVYRSASTTVDYTETLVPRVDYTVDIYIIIYPHIDVYRGNR